MSSEIGIDTTELRALLKRMEKAEQKTIDQFLQDVLLQLVYRLDAKVKKRTPVDTGNLRRNWRVGDIRRIANGYQVEYFNNTEYAPYIEFGHRQKGGGFVPGRYMLKISEQELQQEAEKLIMKETETFLKSIFEGG